MEASEWKDATKFQKRHLYEITKSRMIPFEEWQADGSKDKVLLHFNIAQNEKGYYAEEYLPNGIPKNGNKFIDITAIKRNDAKKIISWHLYDVKKSLKGEHTAIHLCAQWNAGLKHLRQAIRPESQVLEEHPDVGVFTRYYDEKEMQETKDFVERLIESLKEHGAMPLAMKKSYLKLPQYQAQLAAVEMILNKKFCPEDETSTYDIHIEYLEKVEDRVFQKNFEI